MHRINTEQVGCTRNTRFILWPFWNVSLCLRVSVRSDSYVLFKATWTFKTFEGLDIITGHEHCLNERSVCEAEKDLQHPTQVVYYLLTRRPGPRPLTMTRTNVTPFAVAFYEERKNKDGCLFRSHSSAWCIQKTSAAGGQERNTRAERKEAVGFLLLLLFLIPDLI